MKMNEKNNVGTGTFKGVEKNKRGKKRKMREVKEKSEKKTNIYRDNRIFSPIPKRLFNQLHFIIL